MLKYSKFKKALFGVSGFVFLELEDGMGADVDIENKAIELRPLADLRVYKNVYTGEITKPTKEEIEKEKSLKRIEELGEIKVVENYKAGKYFEV